MVCLDRKHIDAILAATVTKRILIHFTAKGYGGIESHVTALAVLLVEAGHSVDLTSHRGISLPLDILRELDSIGVRLVRPPNYCGPGSLVITRTFLFTQLHRRRYDVIIGQGHGRAFLWLRRFLAPGGQLIWHEHWDALPTRGDDYPGGYGTPDPEPFGRRMSQVAQRVDGILVDSRRANENLRHIQRVQSVKVKTVRPLTSVCPSGEVEDRSYEPASPICIGMIGRHGRGKGSVTLARLWSSIEGIEPATLEYWGPAIEASIHDELREIARKDPTFRFHGPFAPEERSTILHSLDLGLLVAVEEGYGLVVVEYMAAGVPFLMTDVGASFEFGFSNPDGMVVPVDELAVARGIAEMVDRIRSGRTSRQRQRARFDQHHAPCLSHGEYLQLVEHPKQFWEPV